MILTILIPFFVILVVNVSISLKLMQFSKLLYLRMRPTHRASHELCRLHGRQYGGIAARPASPSRSNASSITGKGIPAANNNMLQNPLHHHHHPHHHMVLRTSPSYKLSPQQLGSTTSELVMGTAANSIGSSSQITNMYTLLSATYSTRLKRSKSYSRTTRILILISLTYILLNSLMVYSKLRQLFIDENYSASSPVVESSFSSTTLSPLPTTLMPRTSSRSSSQLAELVFPAADLLVATPTIQTSTAAKNRTSRRLEGNHDEHLPDPIDYSDELIERISCYLYYLNFSINFFLYVLNKSKFRDIFLNIFKRNRNTNSR